MGNSDIIKISRLRPMRRGLSIRARVLEKGDVVEGVSKKTGSKYRLAEILIGDETGIIKATLWGKTIELVDADKTYEFINVDTTIFRNALRVNISEKSTIRETEEIEKEKINTKNDMSMPRRKRNY